MATSNVLQNNQQHPFLFQPQAHQYTFTDDVDSPPSLTNSSESPRSTSEEGESSSPHFDVFDRPHTNGLHHSEHGKEPDLRSSKIMRKEAISNGKVGSEVEDLIMSPIQAASPSWDAVFASSTVGDEMDLITSVAEMDNKQWKPAQDSKAAPAVAVVDSSNGGARDEDIKTAMARGAGLDLWSQDNSFQTWPSGGADNRANDEAMFDSLIQEDSFE
jgi:hypothetical protein